LLHDNIILIFFLSEVQFLHYLCIYFVAIIYIKGAFIKELLYGG